MIQSDKDMKGFHAGELIRHKKTGQPMIIMTVYPYAMIVIDPQSSLNPTPTLAILERDFDNWTNDFQMDHKEKEIRMDVYITKWQYKPVYL